MGRLKKWPTPDERAQMIDAMADVIKSDPVTFGNIQDLTQDEKERFLDMLLADIDSGKLQ